MPTTTYTPLANATIYSTPSLVTISAIAQTYRDLVLVVKTPGNGGLRMRLNTNDASGVYHEVVMAGNGSTTGSTSRSSSSYINPNYNSSTVPSDYVINIMDYSATDKHKTILTRNSQPTASTEAWAARWELTNAVSTIYLIPSGSTFPSGLSFALYGIAA